jgi:hypothetical protein
MLKDGPEVCHKRKRNHNKSQEVYGSTGGGGWGGVDGPTVLQSVDMFFKRYCKLPKFVDIVCFQTVSKDVFL